MYGYVKLRPLMKDSWAEYEDGGNDCGIALRCYFLERVSQLAPVVLRQLAGVGVSGLSLAVALSPKLVKAVSC